MGWGGRGNPRRTSRQVNLASLLPPGALEHKRNLARRAEHTGFATECVCGTCELLAALPAIVEQAQRDAWDDGAHAVLNELEAFPYWGDDVRGDFDLAEPDHDCTKPLVRPVLLNVLRIAAYNNPHQQES